MPWKRVHRRFSLLTRIRHLEPSCPVKWRPQRKVLGLGAPLGWLELHSLAILQSSIFRPCSRLALTHATSHPRQERI